MLGISLGFMMDNSTFEFSDRPESSPKVALGMSNLPRGFGVDALREALPSTSPRQHPVTRGQNKRYKTSLASTLIPASSLLSYQFYRAFGPQSAENMVRIGARGMSYTSKIWHIATIALLLSLQVVAPMTISGGDVVQSRRALTQETHETSLERRRPSPKKKRNGCPKGQKKVKGKCKNKKKAT
ncbi:hypothetical protein PSTG_14047 [Puccinia striiformis f. sp. tritici PST-78]|uniref:Uncharacterized protein n=2 Tax=Puccinia striiformis f. sp. tritici PST-78 TaxID=1165861 RepID=A0A0L0UZT0_9BASI|nr:hypothetical protein PSTG_14047 [Puccinia striiformis f. sp. tritici PST-78]